MNLPRGAAVAAALLIGLGSVDAGAVAAGAEVLEEVVVAAKRRTPIQNVAATVAVIDQLHIERTLTKDIRDLVRYEPGISVRNDPVRFGIDSFSIRGIGGDRIAVEVDGVGVAESFAVGALADSGRIFTDVDFIERVEILRGPASALYGSDAIGGVIRFQTIDPRDLLDRDARFASRIRTGYRGETNGWSLTALNAWSTGTAELLLGFVHRQDGEADIAGDIEPNPRDSQADQVLAKMILPGISSGPIEITLEAGRLRDDTTVNALLGNRPRFVNTIAMQGDDVAEHQRLSIEQTLTPDHAWMDEALWRVYVQRTDTRQITNELRRTASVPGPAVELWRMFRLEDEAAGAEWTVSKSISAGSWRHELVYGVELDVGRVTEVRGGQERDIATGVLSNVILGERFPLRDFPITRRIEAGAYVQDEIRTAQGRWRLTPGLRFDLYRLRPEQDRTYRETNPGASPVKLDEGAITPKLALAYEVADGMSAFAQYVRGFRLPPFEDVNLGFEIPLFNYRALPNPDLRPETSDGYEAGLRLRRDGWHAVFSTYYTAFEDFIESRVNLGRDPVSGMTLFQSRNIGRARIYGAEFAGRLDMGAAVASMQGWSVALNAAWSRGDDIAMDQPLNSVEPFKASMTIDYDSPSGWGVRLVATGVAPKNRVAEESVPLYRTDGYFVLDAFAHLALGERGRLNLGVGNLTDESYTDWVDVRGRAADDPLVIYAAHPGRHVSATVSWVF